MWLHIFKASLCSGVATFLKLGQVCKWWLEKNDSLVLKMYKEQVETAFYQDWVLRRANYLTEITVLRPWEPTDFSTTIPYLTNLEVLELGLCSQGMSFSSLVKLRSLNLAEPVLDFLYHNLSTSAELTTLTNLTALNYSVTLLDDANQPPDSVYDMCEVLDHLLPSFPKLVNVCASASHVFPILTNLTSLSLYDTTAYHIDDFYLRSLTNLRSLSLLLVAHTEISEETLSLLTNLTRFDTESVHKFTTLSYLTNLNTLGIGTGPDYPYEGITSLTNLTKLLLWGDAIVREDDLLALADRIKCLKLECLTTENTISNATIAAFTNLTKLKLREVKFIENSAISGLTSLEILDIERTPTITSSGIFNLLKLKRVLVDCTGGVNSSDVPHLPITEFCVCD